MFPPERAATKAKLNPVKNTNPIEPTLSLIIAVYGHPDFLERIFASLEHQTHQNFEVLVADDGSADDVKELIERVRPRFHQNLRHVWHEDDGFRKTVIVNRAAAMAKSDYLVFIDGDCVLHHRFLERHYKRRRRSRVLSGRRVMLERELSHRISEDDVRARRLESVGFWWNQCSRTDRKRGFYAPWLFWFRNLFRTSYEILGSNFSVHREDFYEVNGYDERIIGRGLEDNNLHTRFVNSGVKIYTLAHEALQYHLFHTSVPIPHSPETVAEFRDTAEKRTPYGIVKD